MSLKCNIVVEDEVKARIGGLRPEHVTLLWDQFGIFVDGYRYMPKFQLRQWDGKLRFFDKNSRTYTRLLDEIVPYLDKWGYEITLEDHRVQLKVLEGEITENFFELDDFKFRDYQIESANKLLQAGGGFGILATGAGKTSICAGMAAILYANQIQTLIIVPSTDLVNQTAKEFREKYKHFDLPVGTYSGSLKDIHQPIVVATWQSLQNAPHHMAGFQAVIVDEAHGAKADVIKSLINDHGKHIAYRWGVTGTWPKPETDQYALKCSIGTPVCSVSAAYLIERGYLSSVEIECIETQELEEDMPDYASEKSYLSKNEDRIQLIAEEIMAARDTYGNTLALVNSIAQGQALADAIPNSVFLWGEIDTVDRKEQYDRYAEQDGIIIIASFGIASTGLSIDRIFCMCMVDTGKAFIKCIQSVGRGLRKRGDKNHVVVKDIYSKMKFGKKHVKDRKTYYKEAEYPYNKTSRKLKYGVSVGTPKGLLL